MVLGQKLFGHIGGRIVKIIGLLGLAAMATACSTTGSNLTQNGRAWGAPVYGPATSHKQVRVARNQPHQAIARGSAHQKIGRPYTVAGKTYIPARDDNYDRKGIASWYGPNFHGKRTANGEMFDQNALTAAHPTLPLPSIVRVTNLDNSRQILVRVNDRGPFVDNRLIDMSRAAATELGYRAKGTAHVRVQYVGPAPLQGNNLPVMKASASRNQVRPQSANQQPKKAFNPNVWPEDPKGKYKLALSRPRISKSGWYVQAAAFSSRSRAQAIARSINVGSQTSVQAAYVAHRNIYRVLVGPYTSREQADAGQRAVVAAGFMKARVTVQN